MADAEVYCDTTGNCTETLYGRCGCGDVIDSRYLRVDTRVELSVHADTHQAHQQGDDYFHLTAPLVEFTSREFENQIIGMQIPWK